MKIAQWIVRNYPSTFGLAHLSTTTKKVAHHLFILKMEYMYNFETKIQVKQDSN